MSYCSKLACCIEHWDDHFVQQGQKGNQLVASYPLHIHLVRRAALQHAEDYRKFLFLNLSIHFVPILTCILMLIDIYKALFIIASIAFWLFSVSGTEAVRVTPGSKCHTTITNLQVAGSGWPAIGIVYPFTRFYLPSNRHALQGQLGRLELPNGSVDNVLHSQIL